MADEHRPECAAPRQVGVLRRDLGGHRGDRTGAPAPSTEKRETVGVHEWTVAGGLLETPDGVLLVRNLRRGGLEDWSTPGGVIDADDADLLAGLTREVEEETGLRVREWSGPLYEVRAARARHGLADALRGAPRGGVRRRRRRRRSRRHRGRGRLRARRPNARRCSRRARRGSASRWRRGCATAGRRAAASTSATTCSVRRATTCASCAPTS